MSVEDLKMRFRKFAINTALLLKNLPQDKINSAYCNQLTRSSSSGGANYRAACRGKSTAGFINKLKIVEEEVDESIYFLELLLHFNEGFNKQITTLTNEGKELLAITVQSIKTSRTNQTK